MKNLSYYLISLSLLFYIGCKEDNNPVDPGNQDPTVKIPESTKIISETDYNSYFVSISNDSTVFTFSSALTTDYNPKVNDVLYIPTTTGLLRKITNIQQSNNQVIISTTQGTFEEAIEEGSLSYRTRLSKSQMNKISYLTDGVILNDEVLNKYNSENFLFSFNKIIYDVDGDTTTQNDQVRLLGTFNLEQDILFDIEVRNFALQSVRYGYEMNNDLNLTLQASFNYQIEKSIQIARITFNPIFLQIGPLPVVIIPEIFINIGISGYANASLETSIDNELFIEAGVEYRRATGWGTYQGLNDVFTFNQPQITANAGARGYVAPEISMAVYGVLAAYARGELYAEIVADLFSNPWWSFYMGLDLGAGARANLLGAQLFNYSKDDLITFRKLIAEAPAGGQIPNPPTLSSPSNGATNVSIPVSLSWNASSGATSYTLQVSTNSSFTNLVYDQSALTGTSQQVTGLNNSTQYYWHVSATNSYGTSAWSSVWSFTTSGSIAGKKMLYLKNGDPSSWTTPGASGSQAEEISRWENAGFEVTTMDLSNTTITSSLLSNYDILRLYSYKGRGYTSNESNAISSYVTNGGNLFADVPHTSDVSAVSFFGVDNILGNNGGSNGLDWFYHGAPYVFGPITGPTGSLSTMAIECMDRPVLKSNHSLTIDATVEGYPAIAHGSFGSGKIVLMLVVSWSHDATYPGNAYRANIYQEQNLQFLQNCIVYLN